MRLLPYSCLYAAALLVTACASSYQKSKPDAACLERRLVPEPGAIRKALGLPADLESQTGVYSLEAGGENLFVRAWLCDHAEKTLDIQYYIFARDNSGLIACDYLLRAADRGVKIRLIIDDATVRLNTHEMSLLDSHERIHIRVYNPGVKLGSLWLRLREYTRPQRLHRRMHNKTFIVDNVAAITGGRNIADEYFDYHDKYNFTDRDVLLIGKTANEVTRSFEVFWQDQLSVDYDKLVNYKRKKSYSEPGRFQPIHEYACDTAHLSDRVRTKIARYPEDFRNLQSAGKIAWTKQVSFVSDLPEKTRETNGSRGRACTDSMLALLKHAKKSVDIQSPYLILDDEAMAIFRDLVARGVRVRVLTNSLASTDNFEAFSAYKRDRDEVLETGIEVYEFRPHPVIRFKVMSPEIQESRGYKTVLGMHSKSMLIDGKTVVIGSYNLDPRSAHYNTECVAIIRQEETASRLKSYIDEEFLPENAWRTTKEYNPDGEAGIVKRMKLIPRRLIPKKLL
jgi:cardiolipin synthase C